MRREEHAGKEPDVNATDEARRLAAVRRYAVPDDPGDGALDRVASLAARIFHAPIATVTIIDDEWVRCHAGHGISARLCQTRRAVSLCASALAHDGAFVIPDASADPRVSADPMVAGEPGVRFYAAAPITTPDGHRLGSVNVMDTRPRQAGVEELDALRDLAALVMGELESRLATSRIVAAERRQRADAERLARILQRTLLPPALPQVPGLHAAAAYHPVSADEVGGDFYDLFPLDGNRWGFFLGDVCGKGADAAVLTSLIRYTLRAAAVYDPDPCTVLANLDAVLQQEHAGGVTPPPYCTAIFGVLEPGPDGFTVTLAGGGHPPALIVRANGTVEPLHPDGGQLIGILRDPHFAQVSTRLNAGDALLLYTDGLTEARTASGSMLDQEGLAAYLASTAPAGADDLLATVHELITTLGKGVSDDTAVLALSIPVRSTTVASREPCAA
ncbi:GAF domain-containing protein [Sphaerisporangium album]|uniref:GAF domain-containing protein n=1 Tax=Sphaerisporangium album TaxID=509200 RepID=A0A367FLR5_9ACTN|nr:GAF domain-containing SpoIIE family protein phosphatase [Sphaerisporangium album]RCG30565.1 GAF domain-containing protein [Sphaerisporangium album]